MCLQTSPAHSPTEHRNLVGTFAVCDSVRAEGLARLARCSPRLVNRRRLLYGERATRDYVARARVSDRLDAIVYSPRAIGELLDPRTEIVRAGYDALDERYIAWSGTIEGDPRDRFVSDFMELLRDETTVLDQTTVLDLGCGPGVPSTQQLAERFDVVGVDVSEQQLALARRNVPGARFIWADFADLEFPAESFGGIVALYSLTHVPRERHRALFRKIVRWLQPGGAFLATLSVGGTEDWVGPFVGVTMFFSCYDADTSRTLLRDAGLDLVADEVVEQNEPGEGTSRFLCG